MKFMYKKYCSSFFFIKGRLKDVPECSIFWTVQLLHLNRTLRQEVSMICSISDSFSSCSLAQNQLNLRRSQHCRDSAGHH